MLLPTRLPLASSGIYTATTGHAWCPNLWGRDEVPLPARLRDVAFVAIGTGVGILSGGRVLQGAHGIAGAAGWFALDPDWTESSGTVFGILLTIALCGGMTIPWAAGQLADGIGLRWVFVLAVVNFGAVAVLSALARRDT